MIHGTTVILQVKTQTGSDPFGAPIYSETPVEVENVLVGNPTPEERTDELNLTGRKIEYVLGIPKGDAHDWECVTVEFFGKKFRTFGIPEMGIEENIPMEWHKKVKCERFE